MSEVVKSCGNSWVVCRSRSYGGRTYYFNTLTGEAAWNLSESEIEKAKKTTRTLQNQPDFYTLNCPEPSESPQDPVVESTNILSKTTHTAPSKIYNKQIINNRFPSTRNIFPIQYSHSNNLNPIAFNVPIPAVFNVTPQPIYITPTSMNQPHSGSNNNINNDEFLMSKTSVPISKRFKNLHDINIKSTFIPETFNRNYDTQKATTSMENSPKKNKMRYPNTPDTDLRLLLASKRKSLSEKDAVGYEKDKEEERRNSHISSDIDDDDNNEIILKKVDTTMLKTKLQIQDDSELWYIITDSNVLLNHISFVDVLLKSDSQCRLVILQSVINKIENARNSRLRSQAHLALSIIYKNLDTKVAIGYDEGSENVNDKYEIINVYNNFSDKGDHAIIVTDDIELHSIYDNTIPVYTSNELKRLLISNAHDSKLKNHDHKTTSLSQSIKITIPNDTELISNEDSNASRELKLNTTIKEPIFGSPHKHTVSEKYDDFTKLNQKYPVKQSEADNNTNTFDSSPYIHNFGPLDPKRHNVQPKKNVVQSSQTSVMQDTYKDYSNQYVHNMEPCNSKDYSNQHLHNMEPFNSKNYSNQHIHNLEPSNSKDYSNQHIHNLEPSNSKDYSNLHIHNLEPSNLKDYSNQHIHNLEPCDSKEDNVKPKKKWKRRNFKFTHTSVEQDIHPEESQSSNSFTKETHSSPKCLTKYREDSNEDMQSNASNNKEQNSLPVENIFCNVLNRLDSNPNNVNEEASETCSVTKVPENFVAEEKSLENSNSVSNKIVDSIKKNPHPGGDNRDMSKKNTKKNNPTISKDTIMFDITSQAMEENLKTKCDEWIYRFVQIMEEALTQVLQVDPPYILETMPPPWNLYEAVECIKRKFIVDEEVVETSCKLSDILFDIGALRGKIKLDLSPEKYMEMYSYGVHVIDALNEILNNNDDLQIAVKSLSSLLHDIQDPHMDQTNQDSFTDISFENQTSFRENETREYENNENQSHENPSLADEDDAFANRNYRKLINPVEANNSFIDESYKSLINDTQENEIADESYRKLINEIEVSIQSNKIQMDSNIEKVCSGPEKDLIKSKDLDPSQTSSPKSAKSYKSNPILSKYNLRSKKKTIVQAEQKSEEALQVVKFIRKIDVGPKASFLSTFHLKKSLAINESSTTDQQDPIATNFEPTDNTANSTETVQNEETKASEPKIVRNFTMFQEFEERLKKNAETYEQDTSEMDQAYEELFYEENYDYYNDYDTEIHPELPEHFDNDYIHENHPEDPEHVDEQHTEDPEHSDEPHVDEHHPEDPEHFDEPHVDEHLGDSQHFEETTTTKNKVTFKSVFFKIENEIRTKFILVHRFCEQSYENLTKTDGKVRKIAIKKKAEKTHAYLESVCESLSNILKRESGNSGERIEDVFVMGDEIVDEENLKNYRILIGKCLQQGTILKEAIGHLMDACKE